MNAENEVHETKFVAKKKKKKKKKKNFGLNEICQILNKKVEGRLLGRADYQNEDGSYKYKPKRRPAFLKS